MIPGPHPHPAAGRCASLGVSRRRRLATYRLDRGRPSSSFRPLVVRVGLLGIALAILAASVT